MKIHVLENNNELFSVVMVDKQAIVVESGYTDFVVGDKFSESMAMTHFKHVKSFDANDELCQRINKLILPTPCENCDYSLCA